MCALGKAGGDEQLRRRIGEDHRADVPPVQHGAALLAEAALEIQQRRTDGGNGCHRGGGGIGDRPAQVAALQVGRPQRARRGLGRFRVGGIGAGVQHEAADGAVQQAGVQIRQAKRRREPPCQGAFSRGGGSVDCYDGGDDRAAAHAAASSPPASFISSTKPGKLVSMKPASSTTTG